MSKTANARKFSRIDQVKTTIILPRVLWRRARILAAETDRNFVEIVRDALDSYLTPTVAVQSYPPAGGGDSGGGGTPSFPWPGASGGSGS